MLLSRHCRCSIRINCTPHHSIQCACPLPPCTDGMHTMPGIAGQLALWNYGAHLNCARCGILSRTSSSLIRVDLVLLQHASHEYNVPVSRQTFRTYISNITTSMIRHGSHPVQKFDIVL
jgi:hypothetical protein